MSRILIPDEGKWYSEINLISYLYETELEAKIVQHSDEVFKEFYVLPFKKTLQTIKGDTSTPDIVMIRKDYSEWWLVEVEKANHSIGHVEDQVKVFKDAVWNSLELTDYIFKIAAIHGKTLDKTLLYSLISDNNQNIMVIVDEPKNDWKKTLRKYNVKLCVFQVYLSTKSTELYRIHGEYPYIYISESHCMLVKGLPNLLEIYSPDILDCSDNDEMDLEDDFGKLTRWKRQNVKSKVYLTPIGRNPLQIAKDYVIAKDTEGRFHVRLN